MNRLQNLLVVLTILIILPVCLAKGTCSEEEAEYGGVTGNYPDTSYDVCGEFTCENCADKCESGELEPSQERETFYFTDSSVSITYPPQNYFQTPNLFNDGTAEHRYYKVTGEINEGTDTQFCCYAKISDCDWNTRICEEWQDCTEDQKEKTTTKPIYYFESRFSTRARYCPNGEDGSTGCICVDKYCQGWCMDNAPAYDGLAECSEIDLDCSDSDGGSTICERYFGGTCDRSSEESRSIFSGNTGELNFCSGHTSSKICYIDNTISCSALGGTCIEKLSMWRTSKSSDAYCSDEDDNFWRVTITSGSEFSDCPGMDCCVPKYTLPKAGDIDPLELACGDRYSLVADEHESTTGSSCFCNYLAINDFYECSDAHIDDSHPCVSENCAPDFIDGHSYCCPSGSCSHLNDDSEMLCLDEDSGEWVSCDTSSIAESQGEVSCFPDGSEIKSEGLHLKCENGIWRTTLGCGETIYNYPLYGNSGSENSLEATDENLGSDLGATIAFNLDLPDGIKTEVLAQVYPADNSVSINFLKELVSCEYTASCLWCGGTPDYTEYEIASTFAGDEVAVLEDAVGKHLVTFKGTTEGNLYNISVFCYAPDEEPCEPSSQQCGPDSYCSEDIINNLESSDERNCNPNTGTYRIGEYHCKDRVGSGEFAPRTEDRYGDWATITSTSCFYCCPKDTCAYMDRNNKVTCYEEGTHEIDGCKWVCQNNEWGKGGDSNIECDNNCDCNLPGDGDFRCTPALVKDENGNERSLCCNQTSCAVDNHCVDTGTRVWHNGKLNVCQSDGTWIGSGIKVITNYRRIVLNKEKSEVEVKLELRKDDLFDAETASAKIYHFFDNSQFTGDITISSTDESGNIQNDYEGLAESEIKVPSGDSTLEINEIPYSYKATISADLSNDEYLIYLGSVMVVEAE